MRIITTLSNVDGVLRKTLYDSVVRNLISGIGLSPDTKIKYEGDLENNHQPLSEEGEKTAIDFGQIKTITVVVDEDPDPHAESVRSLDTNLEEDIFFDPRYGLKITPVCEVFDTKLTLNFRSSSKDEVRRLIQRLRTRINTGHGAIATGGEFSYPIPHNALQPIIDLYNTAIVKDEAGIGQIDAYFKDHLAPWVTVTAKQNGKGAQFTARKQVSGVHLIYDHDEPQYDKKQTNYTAGFTVSFKLERPTELRIEYPLIVAGSPMPEDYWPDLEPPWIVPREGYKNPLIQSEIAIDNYVLDLPWHYTVDYNGVSGKDTMIIFSSDCGPEAIDPTNPGDYLLLNLHELPFDFTPVTWKYLESIAEKDQHMTTSIIRVGYHIGGTRVDVRNVWLDSDMRIWSNAPYEVWRRNQFTIELVTDVGYDNNKTIDTLRPYPELMYEYVSIVAPVMITDNPTTNKPSYPSYPGSPGYPSNPSNPDNPGYPSSGGTTRPSTSPGSPNTIDWDYVLTKPTVPVDVIDQVVIGITKEPARMNQMTVHNNSILVMKAEG